MPGIVEHLKLPKLSFRRQDVADDVKASVVLGVESVPDGLASGLLAGVNPVAGLYAYMFGVASAALFTSTSFMAVQGTGAMAIIVNDVDLASSDDPTRALVTLSVLTGIVMILAGYLKVGGLLKFVSNSVMTGFISAVGLNIVLGQFADVTGYDSTASSRVTRALDTILHPGRIDFWTVMVGIATIVLIVLLRRTRMGAMGMVVAIGAGSALAAIIRALDQEIALVGDVAEVPNRLPVPTLPALGEAASLIIPAISLAFVGLVQGAGVSSAFPNVDGENDTDRDFIGQGVGNLGAGLFQGVPVGGSMSASSLITSAGAKSRWALVYTAGVMGIVILVFAGVVEHIAMPALAGLLMVVGIETIKPGDILSVYKTGSVQGAVMGVTFVLTLAIPLQFAVLIGVGMSMILYVGRQSNQLDTRRLIVDDGGIEEVEPPEEVSAHDVVVLQPYGSLFFASAPVFEEELPTVSETSVGSVVILRFRGKPDIGSTLIEVLERYSGALQDVGSKLVIVTDSDRLIHQLRASGVMGHLGEENVYRGTTRLLATVVRASSDAEEWVAAHLSDDAAIEETPIAGATLGDLHGTVRRPAAPDEPSADEPDDEPNEDEHADDGASRDDDKADPDAG